MAPRLESKKAFDVRVLLTTKVSTVATGTIHVLYSQLRKQVNSVCVVACPLWHGTETGHGFGWMDSESYIPTIHDGFQFLKVQRFTTYRRNGSQLLATSIPI